MGMTVCRSWLPPLAAVMDEGRRCSAVTTLTSQKMSTPPSLGFSARWHQTSKDMLIAEISAEPVANLPLRVRAETALELQSDLSDSTSWHNGDPCTFAAPHNTPRERLERKMPRVLVPLLDLSNLVDVLHAQGAGDSSSLLACLARARLDSSSLADQVGCRRRFRDEGEGAVRLNGDEHWRWCPWC